MNINKVIEEWIGELEVDVPYLMPEDPIESGKILGRNYHILDLRSRIPELEEKLIKELQEKLVLYNILPPQVEMENPSMWEGHQIAFKKMKDIINLLTSKE
jgi:hypothetical protein